MNIPQTHSCLECPMYMYIYIYICFHVSVLDTLSATDRLLTSVTLDNVSPLDSSSTLSGVFGVTRERETIHNHTTTARSTHSRIGKSPVANSMVKAPVKSSPKAVVSPEG